MEEEDTLSDTPKRSGSELVGAGTTLCDAVGEAFAHVVDEKVRVKIRRLIGKRSVRACRCCAPREYPTLINVSSATNVSSPGTVLTPCPCVDYRANRKAPLDKVSDAQRFELSPVPLQQGDVNRPDTKSD